MKTKKTRKRTDYFQPKYGKRVVEFITDKIEEGMVLADVCKNYGPPNSDIVPNEKSCYRWMKKYPEFKKQVNEAYKTLIIRLIDQKVQLAERAIELSSLVNESLDEDSMNIQIKQSKFELDAIKVKQRALEFLLTRIGPKFVDDLKDSPAQDRIAQLPPITIISYTSPKNLTEGEE